MKDGTRKLAAIMFTDVVGFTALMAEDEQKTFEVLEKNRKVLKPLKKNTVVGGSKKWATARCRASTAQSMR